MLNIGIRDFSRPRQAYITLCDVRPNNSFQNNHKRQSSLHIQAFKDFEPPTYHHVELPYIIMVRRAARTHTTARRPGLFTRLRGRASGATYEPETTTVQTTTTTTRTKRNNRAPRARLGRRTHNHGYGTSTTAAPVHHHRRRPSMGDKISGAMMKLRGSLTRRPGLKVRSRPA